MEFASWGLEWMSETVNDCETGIHTMHLIVIFIVQIKTLNNNQMYHTKTLCNIKINIPSMAWNTTKCVSPVTNTSSTSSRWLMLSLTESILLIVSTGDHKRQWTHANPSHVLMLCCFSVFHTLQKLVSYMHPHTGLGHAPNSPHYIWHNC